MNQQDVLIAEELRRHHRKALMADLTEGNFRNLEQIEAPEESGAF
jgi:hypothetical protein